MYADTHIHLTYKSFDNEVPCLLSSEEEERIISLSREEIISKMQASGVEFCIEPGIDFKSNLRILDLASRYPDFVYPVVGIHPTRVYEAHRINLAEIGEMAKNLKVKGIGETGLDYHLERKDQHRLRQMYWFISQIMLADLRELPVVFHIRDADRDAISIMRLYKKRIHGGVIHCFNKGPKYSRIYTEEFGFLLGIGGSLLNAENTDLKEAVKRTDLKYMILETDGPFVRPDRDERYSGKQWKKARNTSLIIPDVAREIGRIKNASAEEVMEITTENARALFNVR